MATVPPGSTAAQEKLLELSREFKKQQAGAFSRQRVGASEGGC